MGNRYTPKPEFLLCPNGHTNKWLDVDGKKVQVAMIADLNRHPMTTKALWKLTGIPSCRKLRWLKKKGIRFKRQRRKRLPKTALMKVTMP